MRNLFFALFSEEANFLHLVTVYSDCQFLSGLTSCLVYWFVFPQGFLRPCHQVSSLDRVFVEPVSADDWEILVGNLVTYSM